MIAEFFGYAIGILLLSIITLPIPIAFYLVFKAGK
jgi:hypothetical protein